MLRNKLSLGAGLLLLGLLLLLGAVATRAAQFSRAGQFGAQTFERDFQDFKDFQASNFKSFDFQSDFNNFTAHFSRTQQFDGSFGQDFGGNAFGFEFQA